uniref:Protein kinase domain-containing protein n=1 Tax=Heterorhabditis bacteriophora TaxID=37862 RepID=A0A1I7WM50_HETBA
MCNYFLFINVRSFIVFSPYISFFFIFWVKGPLSVIHRAVHRTTQKQYAIKTIDLKRYERNTGLGRQALLIFICIVCYPFFNSAKTILLLLNYADLELLLNFLIRKQSFMEEGRYSLSGSCWAQISDSAKDLLIRCLTVDDDKRITAIEALNHEWIKDREHFAPRRHMQDAVENIRKYNHRRKLKFKMNKLPDI